jgi:cytoskeletal protein CcmA (bactofilin family)
MLMRNYGLDQRHDFTQPPTMQPPPSSSRPGAAPTPGAQRGVAVLGPTLRFKGELSAEEDFILQGRIEGSIKHTQSVTIGTEGVVQGNIHARVVTVDGSVEGDLHGTESVVINATGRVTGNVFAPRVGIIDGALFNGRVDMGSRQASAAKQSNEAAGVPLSAEETERMLGPKP